MRLASEETLARAARLRRSGLTWLQLTRTPESRQAGLALFRGSQSGGKRTRD